MHSTCACTNTATNELLAAHKLTNKIKEKVCTIVDGGGTALYAIILILHNPNFEYSQKIVVSAKFF